MDIRGLAGIFGPTWLELFDRIMNHPEAKQRMTQRHADLLWKADFRQFFWHYRKLNMWLAPLDLDAIEDKVDRYQGIVCRNKLTRKHHGFELSILEEGGNRSDDAIVLQTSVEFGANGFKVSFKWDGSVNIEGGHYRSFWCLKMKIAQDGNIEHVNSGFHFINRGERVQNNRENG